MTTEQEARPSAAEGNVMPAPVPAFTSAAKAERYDSGRFLGATGLNWYTSDPSLQRTLRYYMPAEDLEWATPYLDRWGALMGGPVSQRAEETDRNPPRLVKYDRWGHDVSEVVLPESMQLNKRAVLDNRFSSRQMVELARQAGARTELPRWPSPTCSTRQRSA